MPKNIKKKSKHSVKTSTIAIEPPKDELNIRTPNLTVFAARRNSGKTHMMTWLLYQMKHLFDYILIINPTSFNGHWGSICNNIIQEFDEDILTKIMDKQAELLNKNKPVNRVLVVLDDCMSFAQFGSKVFERLASQGRHYNLTVWLSIQHYTRMPKCVRNNTDYMIISGNQTCYKTIFEDFGGDYDRIKDFIAKVKESLVDYRMFCIDSLKNMHYTIRAPDVLPKFRIVQK
jgi:hypothetical protein